MISIGELCMYMWEDPGTYIMLALGLGFLVRLRELFAKKKHITRDIPLGEDEGIGILWDTMPPPLKIQRVKLKIKKDKGGRGLFLFFCS